MNQTEQELFLALCRFKEPDREKLKSLLPDNATATVLGELFFNRVQAIAYGVLKETGLLYATGREFRNSLAGAYQQNIGKNKSFFQCIQRLSDILKQKKEKYAMLKGALLCDCYPEGYRTSNDIDLLVRPEDVTEIGEALTAAGFRQGNIRNGEFEAAGRQEIIESKMMRGETVPYILDVQLPYLRFLEVDINYSLDYKNSDTKVIEEMLGRAGETSLKESTIITLDKYDFFIHLCSHLYKEATTFPWIKMKRDMTLYKFCDIYMLMSDFLPVEISKLFRRAEVLGMADICSCVFLWTDALFSSGNLRLLDFARYCLSGKESILYEIIAPATRKTMRYLETDIKKRFFSDDRLALLQEV